MIEALKSKLWELLRSKQVSLALIYDREGHILWHRGRRIRGHSVGEGEGFSRTAIEKTLEGGTPVSEDEVFVTTAEGALPESARSLFIKTILVYPIGSDLFLYVDSGSVSAFDEANRRAIGIIGELLAETLASARERSGTTGGLTGTSPQVQSTRALCVKYAVEEEPVLVLGETGVGKGRVAALIHTISGRRGAFVVVPTPSVPETLLESELFGHRKGAFTGATEDRKGLVEEASDGTLFLDEIGDLSPALQAKLLRFAETGMYRLVGESRERQSSARLITATHHDLASDVRKRRFREDLYYRLSVLQVEIPPLRDRPEDIRAITRENLQHLRGKTPTEGFWRVLLDYDWPGNVRQLLHVLTRAGIECPGESLGEEVRDLLGGPGTGPGAQEDLDTLRLLNAQLEAGRSFWDTHWKAFMARDLNRRELRGFLRSRFADCGDSLKRLSQQLNVEETEYSRFVTSLHKQDIHPGR
jgi:DNA-binding NtrC family response regulator